MKKPSLAAMASILIALSVYTGPTAHADDDSIRPEHRVCERNEDCALIYTACACKCGGAGNSDAVNKNYAEQYKYLEKCTSAEIKSCAEAGACARVKTPAAVCQNEQCAVVWQPVHRQE